MELTRMMSACQSTSFAKQLESRVSSWPGIMDLIFSVAGSVAKWYSQTNGTGIYPAAYYTDPRQAPLRSPMMDAVMDMMYASTCARQARAAGIALSEAFNVQTADAVYFADLAMNLNSAKLQ